MDSKSIDKKDALSEDKTSSERTLEEEDVLVDGIDTRDFSDVPSLESLHIDEVEPLSEQEKVPASPSIPVPVPAYSNSRGSQPSSASKTFKGNGGRIAPESMRARAEEVNSGSKLVPKIEDTVGDFFDLEIEIAAWFNLNGDAEQWLTALEAEDPRNTTEVEKVLIKMLVHRSAASITHALNLIVERALQTDWKKLVSLPAESFEDHTLIFLCLCARIKSMDNPSLGSKMPLLDRGVDVVSCLIGQIAGLRWFVGLDVEATIILPRLFMLLRVAILATFGRQNHLRDMQATVWQSYGLDPETSSKEEDFADPVNYAEFINEISKRYPGCAESHNDVYHNLGSVLRNSRYVPNEGSRVEDDSPDRTDPRDLVNNHSSVMPYVPESIVEACKLFKSRVRTTPAVLQLHEVQHNKKDTNADSKAYSDTNNVKNNPEANFNGSNSIKWQDISESVPSVRAVSEVYRRSIGLQKSFIQVILDFEMHSGVDNSSSALGGPGPTMHAALSSIWHLLHWFRAAHILMFEHFSALLFDCLYNHFAHHFCHKHLDVVSTVLEPYIGVRQFWALVTGPQTVYDGAVVDWPSRGSTQLVISHFNRYNLQTYTHLIGISRLVVVGKTQRLLTAGELSVDAYKPLFGLYESELWLQLLQFMKAQVPFTGKRWRYLNIELISAIYMYCPSRIDDNWLSGGDVLQVVRNAPAEESTLRNLIVQFNQCMK